MTEFDYPEEYADNDIIDFVQVDQKSGHPESDVQDKKKNDKAKQPDEKSIINQLKKKTPAEM